MEESESSETFVLPREKASFGGAFTDRPMMTLGWEKKYRKGSDQEAERVWSEVCTRSKRNPRS